MRKGHKASARRHRNHTLGQPASPLESLEQRLYLTAVPTDPYEPNESLAAATNLTNLSGNWLSEMQGRAATGGNDVDWYTIQVGDQPADPARHVRLYFRSATAGGSLHVTVYDSTGETTLNDATVQVPVDTSATSRNPSVDLGVMQPGTYAVKVVNAAGASSATALAYDMKWDAVIPTDDAYESNNGQQQAYNLAGDAGTWLSQLQGQGRQYDEDWYTFYVPPGYTRVALELLFNNSQGDLRLGLFNANGASIASADTHNNGEFLATVVPQAGWYAVSIDSSNGTDDLGTPYDFRWTPLPTSDPYGDISTKDKAQDLSSQQNVPLTQVNGWGVVGGEDWYKINITADALHLSIETSTLPGGVNEVDTLTPSAPIREVVRLTAAATPASDGTFTLTVNGETTANIAHDASAAAIGAAVEAVLGAGSVTALDAGGGLAAGGGSCTLTFADTLGPVGVTADLFGLADNPHTLAEVTRGAALTGGTFTITVNGKTTLPINYNATAFSIQQFLENLDNIEPGDVTVTGGPVNTTPIVLTFQPRSGSSDPAVSITTTGLTGGGSLTPYETTKGVNPLVHLALYNSAGDLAVTAFDNTATSVDGSLEADLWNPGTYYIKVTGQTNEAYSLTWNSYAKEDAYGDNDYPQTAYDLGNAASGSLSALHGQGVLADQDYYKLSVAAGRPNLYVESLYNPALGNVNMELYAPDGTLLAFPGANETETIAPSLVGQVAKLTAAATAATGGTFTITVAGQTTGALAYNATSATIQAAVAALSSVGANKVTAIDAGGGLGANGGTSTLTFAGSLGAVDVSASFAGLTGSAHTLNVTPGTFVTGGTFAITVNGQTTNTIAYNATAADIKAAVEALSNVGSGNVSVTGGPINTGAVVLTFAGSLSYTDIPVSIDAAGIVGAGLTSTETTKGAIPLNQVQYTATGSRVWARLPQSVLDAGYLYIGFSGGNGGTSYDFKWQSVGTDDAHEINDTAATASFLVQGVRLWGVGVQKNADWYRIPAFPAETQVYVTCGFDINLAGITMDLMASDGTTILATGQGYDNGSRLVFDVSGDASLPDKYVRITGSNAGNMYDLKWTRESATDAYGDNGSVPSATDLGNAATGSLIGRNGHAVLGSAADYYRLNLDAGRPTLRLDSTYNSDLGDLTLELFGPDANEVQTLAPVSEVISLTANATPATAGTFTLTVGGQTTAALAYNASAAAIQAAVEALASVGAGNVTVADDGLGLGYGGGSVTLTFAAALGALEVTGDFGGLTGNAHTLATVSDGGLITGGTFTITVAGQTTAGIPYNATAAEIQAALEGLSSVGAGNVTVTGGPVNTAPVVVTFVQNKALQYVPLSLTVDQLTGGSIAAAETNQGGFSLASGPRILTQLPDSILVAGYCYIRVTGSNTGLPYDIAWKTGVGGANFDDAYERASGNQALATAYDLSANKGQWLSDLLGLGILWDNDFYRIPVTPGQPRISVQVSHNLGVDPREFSVQILGPDGFPLATGQQTSGGTAAWAAASPSAIEAGYIYLLVSSGSGDAMGTAYDVKWDSAVAEDQYGATSGSTTVAENDAMQTAYPLPANPQGQWLSEVTGKGPGDSRDADWYRLSITAAQPRVYVQAKAAAFLGTVSVRLYRSDGTLLAQSQALPAGALLTTVLPPDVLAQGACYILISGDTKPGTPTGILYDFRYQTLAADDSPAVNDTSVTARNVTPLEASSISAISGNTGGNDDWYSITVPANARAFSALVSNEANFGLTLELYDDQGTRLSSSPSFNARASVNYNLPAAGSYRLMVHMDTAGVPYSLQWDAQEAASRVTIGTGGVTSAVFTEADGTHVTVTAGGGGAVVLDFLGGHVGSSVRAGVVTVTGDAGTLHLDRVDLSSATRQTKVALATDRGGDGRVTVNSIIGSAIVGSLYAPTTDVVGEGISMIGDGVINQLTLGAMGQDTALIMPGSGLTAGTILKAGLFSSNMIAAFGSPLSSLTLGAWVGPGSTLTGSGITRLNVTGLSTVDSLPDGLVGDNRAKILSGVMEADLLIYGKDAAGKSIGAATVAGNARGTWDVSGSTVGDIGSIRLNGPQNDWSLEAPNSKVSNLWIGGDFIQNSLTAKRFAVLTLQGGAALAALEAWQYGTVSIGGDFYNSQIVANGHVPNSADNAPYAGLVSSMTVHGNMTGSAIQAQQITLLNVTGDLNTSTITASGHKSQLASDVALVGKVGTVLVGGDMTSTTLTAGHDPVTGGDTSNILGQIGKVLVTGDIASSTLTAAGASTLSDDRTTTGLAYLRAGHVSDSSLQIAGGVNTVNIIDWLDAQTPADVFAAGWVHSLVTRGAAASGSAPASAGDFQANLEIGDYLQSVNIRGQFSAGITVDYTKPPLRGSAINSFVAGSIKDASIAINGLGGINSISTSEWIDTGVSDLIYAKYVNSLVTRGSATRRGDFQADMQIGDYIGTLSVHGVLKESAVQAQNQIRNVVVGAARDSSIFAGSFTGKDTVGAGNAADNVFDLPSTDDIWAAQTPSGSVQVPGLGRLLRLVVTGAVQDGGYSFTNTNVAAIKMDSISIVHPDESPNAVVFGLASDSIYNLSIINSTGQHAWRMLLAHGQQPAPLGKMEIRIA